jgi:hypothetical protein
LSPWARSARNRPAIASKVSCTVISASYSIGAADPACVR